MMVKLIILITMMVSRVFNMSDYIRFYAHFNMWILLYVDYTSIKWLKGKKAPTLKAIIIPLL